MRLHGCNAYVPTTYQVKSILADKSNLSTSKEAVELLEAVEFATNRGRLDWEKDFVNQIVDIFQTHPVSHDFCCFGEDSLFALVLSFGLVSLVSNVHVDDLNLLQHRSFKTSNTTLQRSLLNFNLLLLIFKQEKSWTDQCPAKIWDHSTLA